MFKRAAAALLLAASLALPANAQLWVKQTGQDNVNPTSSTNPFPVRTIPAPVTPANISTATANIANSSTTVTLAHASTMVIFSVDPAAAACYVCPQGGTCSSTAGFKVSPGQAVGWVYSSATGTFTYIGASASGTYSVMGE